MAGHSIGELCNCPIKCHEKIGAVKNEIFDGFWNLADFDKQYAHLFGLIEVYNVKKRYGETDPELSLNYALNYMLNIASLYRDKYLDYCKEKKCITCLRR